MPSTLMTWIQTVRPKAVDCPLNWGSSKMSRAQSVVLFAAVLALGASGIAVSEEPEPTPQEVAGHLLDEWAEVLVPVTLIARDRRVASEAGDTADTARLESEMNRGLQRVEEFAAQARKRLLRMRETPEAKATLAAGDAWTEWAYELRTNPPAGDFDRARQMADLGAKAIRLFQDAYRAIDREIPTLFRTKP